MNKQKTLALGGVAVLAGIAGASAQGVQTAPLFQIGGVDVRPHATYSAVYDDNIFLEHKDKGSLNRAGNAGRDHDFIHTFTPGLKLNAGDAFARQTAYFAANYEAAVTRFTDYSGANTVDHNGEIAIGGNLQKLKVDLSQTLESRSDADTANLAAGGRVKRKTWTTKVNSKYEVSEKTSAGLDLNQTIGDYEAPLFDTVDRSASLWMDYQVLPKVKMGLGAVVALLLVPLSHRTCLALLLLVGVLHLSLLNQAPASAYFAQTLQTWEQGRFIRFHGLAQWLGWLWPFAVLLEALARLSQPVLAKPAP